MAITEYVIILLMLASVSLWFHNHVTFKEHRIRSFVTNGDNSYLKVEEETVTFIERMNNSMKEYLYQVYLVLSLP